MVVPKMAISPPFGWVLPIKASQLRLLGIANLNLLNLKLEATCACASEKLALSSEATRTTNAPLVRKMREEPMEEATPTADTDGG